jgi:LysM repeat protein
MTHEVQRGEDMLGIALRYGVGLAELTAANPTVNPNIMSIGTILVIPVSLTPTAAGQMSAEEAVALTPTAIPVLMQPVTCTRARDGGIWCFQALENNQDITLESLTGVFHLRAADGQTRTQKAALPLDTLPPGASLPLSAYFSPEDSAGVTEPFQVTSELYTALPNPDDGRYVPSQAKTRRCLSARTACPRRSHWRWYWPRMGSKPIGSGWQRWPTTKTIRSSACGAGRNNPNSRLFPARHFRCSFRSTATPVQSSA